MSMLLADLATAPTRDPEVTGLCMDSRRVQPGDLFLACPGTRTSGMRFIADAARAGAVAALAESGEIDGSVSWTIPVVGVIDLPGHAGTIAARFFGEPSQHLRVIGVTGTNGKSSVSHFIAAALNDIGGRRAGVIGTLGWGLPGELARGRLTTPDPVELQFMLATLQDQGLDSVVMEVSSHALDQRRVAGVKFDIGVFTNLSRDHLDYHRDMEAYGAAKEQLLLQPGLQAAIVNVDDPFGRGLRDRHGARLPVTGYRIAGTAADVAADPAAITGLVVRDDIGDLEIEVFSPWGKSKLRAPLTGRFNAGNLLAALGVLCAADFPFPRAIEALANSGPVPGRMETFTGRGAPVVVVDYAHTPDALAHALGALRGRRPGRLACVFGCGGDRDAGKRPLMGGIAERHADTVYVTSDNPRGEEPRDIIDDILAGMQQLRPTVIEPDRAAAITRAIRECGPEDIVLVAGKGHEDYQEIAGQRQHFSDRELVAALLGERG